MRRRRTIVIIASVLAVAALIALAVYLRGRAAPEAARLLPEADAFIYVNLKPIHKTGVLEQKMPRALDPDYAQFVQATGFQFERDLDEAAFAVHLPAGPANGEARQRYPYPRFSEVFVGRFNTERVAAYFRKNSAGLERYREVEIFSIPLQGRTVRIALLGMGIAAVSNTDDPQIIRGMVDRYKEIALPFGGPELVHEYHRNVPFGSLAWSIARISPSRPGQQGGLPILPGGFDLPFPAGTVIVASVRYLGNVQVKAEAFANTETEARKIADQANTLLGLFRGMQSTTQAGTVDPDVQTFFDSLKVEHSGERATLSATVPEGFLKKIVEEPPVAEAPLVQGQEQPRQPSPKRKSRTH